MFSHQFPADFHFCTGFLKEKYVNFLKEFSTKMKIRQYWVSEYSKFLKLFSLRIETTLKN